MINYFLDIVCATYNCVEKIKNFNLFLDKLNFDHVRVLVCDGGSSDGTLELLQTFSKIQIVDSAKDKGIYDAWNKSLKHVNSSYVAFIGIDDIINPDFIIEAQKLYNNGIRPSVFFGDSILKYNNYTKKKSISNHPTLLSNSTVKSFDIVHQGCLVKSELFYNYQFNLEYKLSADLDFFLEKYELISDGGYFKIKDVIQSYIDFDGISTSYSALAIYQAEFKKLENKYNIKIKRNKMNYFLILNMLGPKSFSLLRKITWYLNSKLT